MKYKRRYNFIICFMLFVITLSAVMFFYLPKLGQVDSEKTTNDIILDNEKEETTESSSTLTKVKFNNFTTALNHAFNYLETTAGYRTYSSGKLSLNVKNLLNIEQDIVLSSEINNKNNTSRSKVCTYGDGKIKNDLGYEFTVVGSQVSVRRSKDRVDGGFDYENKDVTRYNSIEEYKNEWNVMPEEVFLKFSTSKVLNGTMTKNKNTYKLSFTLERGEIVNGSWKFVRRFFDNSEASQNVKMSFNPISIEMNLDEYGRPTTIQYTTTFYDLNLYDVGIPLSGLSGGMTYTQKFYSYGQIIQINSLPDPVQE